MVHQKRYTCIKCGRTFTKMVGGFAPSRRELELELHPVCDKCKFDKITKIIGLKK